MYFNLRIIGLLACLSFLLTSLHGQITVEKLLKKNKYSWVAELENTYVFEKDDFASFEVKDNGNRQITNAIKMDYFNSCDLPEYLLRNTILEGLREGAYVVKDEAGKEFAQRQIITYLKKVDTIQVIDPVTYKEKRQIVETELSSSDIVGFRTKQLLFYQRKKRQLFAKITQVSPIFKPSAKSALQRIWIDMPQPKKIRKDIHHKHINWAKETLTTFSTQDFNVLKGNPTDVWQPLFVDLPATQKIDVYPATSSIRNCDTPLEDREIRFLTESTIDTIVAFNPETFAEKIEIVVNDPWSVEKLKEVRFIQHWYYNKKKHLFLNKLVGIAPLLRKEDDQGNFLYNLPLFYIFFEK